MKENVEKTHKLPLPIGTFINMATVVVGSSDWFMATTSLPAKYQNYYFSGNRSGDFVYWYSNEPQNARWLFAYSHF